MIMVDNQHVVYTVVDPVSTVPNQVFLRTLGTPRSHDRLLFAESDPLFAVYTCLSKDGQFVLVESSSKSTSEMHVLPTTNLHAPLCVIQPRTPGLAYHAEHWHDRFIIVTNWQRPGEFGVAQVPTVKVLNGRGGCESWEHVNLRENREVEDSEVRCEYVRCRIPKTRSAEVPTKLCI
jgi:protease II